jgi:type VI secretion system (T6SS) effector TldE1-like protein
MRRILRRLAFDGAADTPAIERSLRGEQSGTTLDARRMSTSTRACYGFTAHHPRSSARKATFYNFFGGVAVGCLVLGCVWTVYANVFGASIYPAVTGNFDVAVVKRPVAARTALTAANSTIVMESPPAVAAPATVLPGPSLSFDDRFAAAAAQGEPSKSQTDTPKLAEAPKPRQILATDAPKLAEAPKPRNDAPKLAEASKPKPISPPAAPVQVAAIAPAPRPAEAQPAKSPGSTIRDMAQRAKAAVMSIASADKPSMVEKLWGKPQPPQPKSSLLAYASADASSTSSLGPNQNLALEGTQPRYDQSTAVYDISAHMVYLPDGTRLEAHSGLGSSLDDPRSANIRMRGVTPPHLYELTPREALFHGVPALRLNPIGGEEAIYGRAGLLAHTFMLGPRGDSNGCVSFRDYNAFLSAYRNHGIRRLAVVARID